MRDWLYYLLRADYRFDRPPLSVRVIHRAIGLTVLVLAVLWFTFS